MEINELDITEFAAATASVRDSFAQSNPGAKSVLDAILAMSQ